MMFVGNTNLLHLISLGGVMTLGAGIYAVSAPYRLQRFSYFFLVVLKQVKLLIDLNFKVNKLF